VLQTSRLSVRIREKVAIVETSGDNRGKRSRLEWETGGLVFAVGRITTIQPEGSETFCYKDGCEFGKDRQIEAGRRIKKLGHRSVRTIIIALHINSRANDSPAKSQVRYSQSKVDQNSCKSR
jgi:hypothetical protein